MTPLDIYSAIVLISLTTFTIDYLSDAQIKSNETEIGILSYLHHLVFTISTIGLVCFTKSLKLVTFHVIVILIAQLGWLYNNDDCWITKKVNTCINPDNPDRIWRADITLFIKHYTRDDSWGYHTIRDKNKTNMVLFINIMIILNLLYIVISTPTFSTNVPLTKL